ncbi:hypothetical protein F0562_003383 [Nyssa sinensis]|uniref:Uncharacterized protein n=1 Tax=Nyssa sinensis TaxID=561372 RepID=A0A5J5BWC6_9ASTE|nr:hypothetical protein F0562_003383 [Nyssa sinensis]
MASNLPLNANIIDCPPTNDYPHLVQAYVSLSKVHGEDRTVMEAQGAAESIFSPIILNANISNVHGRHDLSALLIESRLDGISEGVDGAAREEVSIHDTCSAHSWADRAKKGEFIPQAALDLKAEFEGFSKDPSFLMESFHGDLSSPSIRGSRSLNNGSHEGRGGGGSGVQVARGVLPLFYPALCSKEVSLQAQNGDFPLGNSEIHRGDGQPTLEKQKGENIGTILLVCPTLCGKKWLTKKVANDQYLLGTSGTYERDGRPSQDKQKVDGTATSSNKELFYSAVRGGNTFGVKRVQPMAMCGISDGAKEEQPLGNNGNQRGGVEVVQDLLIATKSTFSDLKSASKGLSSLDANGAT